MPAHAAVVARLSDVEVRFGTIRALRGLDLRLLRGSLCGLIGPNGAGKTTTLRVLATDLNHGDGVVEVFGWPLPHEAQRVRPRIGYMPDAAGLYEELTLREYLEFFAAFYGRSREQRRAAAQTAMELTNAILLAERRLGGLSKGERQRVLLARTLIHDPEFLILDEPAEGLDPRARVELRELLRLLHERGKTILLSSHVLSDLEDLCTDLVLIDRGRVVFQGDRRRLRSEGAERFSVRIETMDRREDVAERLQRVPFVSLSGNDDDAVEASIPADPDLAADLLRMLVAEGVRVTSFSTTRESLEDLYLRLTAAATEG